MICFTGEKLLLLPTKLNTFTMLVNNTVCLCGYFSAKRSFGLEMLKGWTMKSYSDADIEELSSFYMPEFATFMTRDMKRYSNPIDKPCTLRFEDGPVNFRIDSLHLWLAPFNLVLYAIEIGFEKIEFNVMTRTINVLRNCNRYNESQNDFIQTALQPIIDLYNQLTLNNLKPDDNLCAMIEPGNKFKLFQAISLAEPLEIDNADYLLYDAATVAKHIPNSLGSNSETYYQHIMDNYSISVFNGWKGLALLDTYTMLSIDTPEWVINNWKNDYFGMIYIYQLFRKVFLYNVNLRYRKRTEDVEVLESQLDEFDQLYGFNSVSYNFLPNLINDAIEKSLDTRQDSEQLNKMISLEMEKRQQRSEERTNQFLTFLTCLTIFSAIYDFSSLVNESFDFNHLFSNTMLGFRAVSLLLLLVVAIAYLVVLLRYRKK